MKACLVLFIWLLFIVSFAHSLYNVSKTIQESLPSIKLSSDNSTPLYEVTETSHNYAEPFHWIEVHVKVLNAKEHKQIITEQIPSPGTVNSSFFVPQPVYISLTTMASRMHRVNKTIISLLQARVVPTTIYLFISKEPFLLDTGVKEIPNELLCLVAEGYLKIIYTANIGPHRKLIPALKRHWGEDVFIATVDDDMKRDQGYIILYQLLKHYMLAQTSDTIVALRARRIGLCSTIPHKVTKYNSWPVQTAVNRQEMMLMPTGTGGILYKPSYFHKVIFHKSLRFATGTADDLMFRLATMIRKIPVQLGCSIMRHKTRIIRRCARDEYDRKYDELYGPYSTELFANMTKAVTQQMIRDAEAAKSQDSGTRRLIDVTDHRDSTYTNISPDSLHPDRMSRQLGHTIRYRAPPRHSADKDLFDINRRGGNDQAWKIALDVLKAMRLLSIETLAAEYIAEREGYCYAKTRSTRVERACALFQCDKPRSTGRNTNNTTTITTSSIADTTTSTITIPKTTAAVTFALPPPLLNV